MELPRDLHMNDIRRALGLLEERDATNDLISRVSLFGAGLLVGAGLALLLAPLNGEEMRAQIHDRVDELRGQKPSDQAESKQS